MALRRLWVDWGDGSQAEEALSGRSAERTLRHAYTAAGPVTVTVTVENTAGVQAQESRTLEVLEPETPIAITPGA
ncbi:PKD domain-containing protein [Thermus thermophilus]|uniref:PKD domain-containing protein n=1 Tax=Thermus thermophilus TaxID=274 RepID=UPI001CA6A4CB|nr:hypothetical protein K7H19_11285 [Thermus thermophilus]